MTPGTLQSIPPCERLPEARLPGLRDRLGRMDGDHEAVQNEEPVPSLDAFTLGMS